MGSSICNVYIMPIGIQICSEPQYSTMLYCVTDPIGKKGIVNPDGNSRSLVDNYIHTAVFVFH